MTHCPGEQVVKDSFWKAGASVALAFFSSIHAAPSQTPPVLSVREARDFPRTIPQTSPPPAAVEGVVTFSFPAWKTYFLEDDSLGICFWGDAVPDGLAPGDRIRLLGHLDAGGFAPVIVPTNVTVLGRTTLPPARPLRPGDLLGGAADSQRIAVEGVVCQAGSNGDHTAWVLSGDFGDLNAALASRPRNGSETNWIGAHVRAQGVCSSSFSSQGQFIAPQLLIQRIEDIEVLAPAPRAPSSVPLVPLGRVLEFNPARNVLSQVRVVGTVTAHSSKQEFFLQDDAHALRVRVVNEPLPTPGSKVEVIGFPKPGLQSPRIEFARITTQAAGAVPLPRSVSLANLDPSLDGMLVEMEGVLNDSTPSGVLRPFHLTDTLGGTNGISVRLGPAATSSPGRAMDAGSRIRLAGILEVRPDDPKAPAETQLILRDWNDVHVLRAGPWWNKERASLTAILLGFVVAGGITWSVTLRRRLDEQRRQLEEQLAQRLSLERRHRDLTEGAPDAIYTLDTQGRILSANPASASLTGRTEAELRTMSIFEIVAPDQAERVRTRVRDRFVGGGDAAPFEVDVISVQGQRRTLEVASRILKQPSGASVLEGVARDITERRRAQDALKALLATTAVASGDELFRIIVRRLAEVLKVNTVFIGVLEESNPPSIRVLASWQDGQPGEEVSYPIENTPCTEVVGRAMQVHARNVRGLFPHAACLQQLNAESYVGVPLWDADGRALGLLVVLHPEPFEPDPAQTDMLRILAARTGAELDRVRANQALQASEERFRELAEQTRDILWVADLSHLRLAYLSPSFSRLSDLPIEEVCRNPRRLLRLIPRDDRTRVVSALRKALREPSGRYSTEYRIRRADGSLGWILDEGVVIRNAEGRPHRLSGVARDITTRKEAELALAGERARFRDLFENSPDSIFVESLDGTVLDVNRAACELHGRPREQLVGRHISALVPLRHRESVAAGFARLISGELTRYEGWSLRRDGTEVPVELQVGRIRHEGQESLLVHARDISFRREAQELLDGQKRILEWIATGRHIETVLAELLRVTQARWRSARCGIHWRVSPDDPQLRVVSPSSGPGTSLLLGELARDGGPILRVLAETASRDGSHPSAHAPRPIRIQIETSSGPRAVLVEPMLGTDGRPLGAITAILPNEAEPNSENIELLRLAGSLGGVALQRHRSDTALREGSDRLRVANAAILSLASSDSVAHGDLDRALAEITEAAARGLGVKRANVWLFDESRSRLQCMHAYGDEPENRTSGTVILASENPSYFQALAHERFVSVSNAEQDPRTAELYPRYLSPFGITSTLDAGIRLGGGLVGVICHEHKGSPRTWSNEEELFAGSLADLVAQTIQASQRRSTEDALRQSEEAYGSVASVLAEGVMIVHRDLSFGTFNDSAAHILGRSREYLESHRLDEIAWNTIRADQSELALEDYPLSITFRTGQPVTDSVMGVQRPEGNWVWLSINTRAFARNEDGTVASVLVSFADITSRHSAERELRRGKELLENIRQVQANFIADADPSRNLGHMLTSLAHATRSDSGIIGEVSETTDGRNVFLLCAAMDVPNAGEVPADRNAPASHASGAGITDLMQEVLVTQNVAFRQAPLPSPDHPEAPVVHTLALPLRMDDKILGVAGLTRHSKPYDPEEIRKLEPLLLTCASLFSAIRAARRRQEAEAEIRQLNAELEKRVEERTADLRAMNEELAEFAYVVTHDLKAPLRGIHQLAEWLTHDHAFGLDENGLKLLALLRRRVLHLQRLVDGLLACARVGRSPEPETAVSVGQLIHEVIGVLAPPPQVIIDVPPNLPTIQGNPERLHQIFQNLLDNALKYLDKPEGHIRVQAARQPGAWEFRVLDNGPGIPARYREKVFLIFQRLDSRSDIPGTGLGLTLVRRIIEARGGRAWIESTEGEGTSVCFTWPDRARRRSE